MASTRIETELRIQLEENATATAPRVAAALERVQKQSEALQAALARSNLPDRLQADLQKLRVSAGTVEAAAAGWNDYAKARGIAGKASTDWSKADAAAAKQFAATTMAAEKAVLKEEQAHARARHQQQQDALKAAKEAAAEEKRVRDEAAREAARTAREEAAEERRIARETTRELQREEKDRLRQVERDRREAERQAQRLAHERSGHDNTVAGVAALYAAHQAEHMAVSVLERYREFDKERRYAKVVMGLTDEQQKPLVDQAIRGSANSKFNDVQWLAAQRNLAARGYGRDQVLAFTPIANQLGAAFDVPMEEAVKLFEGAMLGFRKDVSSKDAAQKSAQRTADLEVKTSKISGADAEDLTALYKRGAAAARMAGLSEEQLLAFGGTAKKLNIGGDEAATAFVALTKNLLKPTAEAKVAMHAAGIDFSKYQKAGPVDESGFVSEVARKYGVRLSQTVQHHLRGIFENPDLMKDPDRLMPAVQRYLRSALGGKDAKSLKSIAGLFMSYRDASMKGVDTQGLLAAIMAGMAKNPALANVIFGSKQGGRIAGALDPQMFAKILDQLQNHSEGFADKVASARMEGFNGALDKLTNQLAILETSIGRAFDNDGKGGFLTGATLAAGKFVQALAEANPRLLRAGAEAVALAGAFAALKSVDFLKGGFGIGKAASKLDISASALDTSAKLLDEAAIKLGASKGVPTGEPTKTGEGPASDKAGRLGKVLPEVPEGAPKGLFGGDGLKSIPKKLWMAGPEAVVEYLTYQAVTGVIASLTDAFHPAFPKGYDANAQRDMGPWDRAKALWAHLHGKDTPEEAAAKAAAAAPAPPAPPKSGDAAPEDDATSAPKKLDGARAAGGPVGAGRTYLVGEHGPELFTAGATGQITSHERLMGAIRDPGALTTADVQRVLAGAGRSGMDVETARAVRSFGFDLTRAVDRVADAVDRMDDRATWGRPDAGGAGGGATPYVQGGSGRGQGGSTGSGEGRHGSDGGTPDSQAATPSVLARAGISERRVESGLDAFNLYGAKHRGEGIRPIDPNAFQPSSDAARMPDAGKADAGSVRGTLFSGESGGKAGIYNYYEGGRLRVGHFDADKATVGDIVEAQRSGKMFATGLYQVIPKTLSGAMKALHLKSSDHYDVDTQNRIFTDYLAGSKRPQIGAYIRGEGSIESANLAMAREWASVADPHTGRSYYPNDRASISADRAQTALRGARGIYEDLIARGTDPQTAMRSALLGVRDGAQAGGRADSVGAFGLSGFNGPKAPPIGGATPEGPTRAPATPQENAAPAMASRGNDRGPGTPLEVAAAQAGKGASFPGHIGGQLKVDGTSFRFGSGGVHGSSSIPFGDYPVALDAPGAWGKMHGAMGLNGNQIWDNALHRMRTGILMHVGHSANLITEGCLAFEAAQFPKLKAKVAAMISREGHAYLHVGKDGASITSQKDPAELAGRPDPLGMRANQASPDKGAPHDVHAGLGALHGATIAPAIETKHLKEAAGYLDHIHGRMKDIHRMSASAQGHGGGTRMAAGSLNARLRGGFASAGSSFG